jgi:hypothetical protein
VTQPGDKSGAGEATPRDRIAWHQIFLGYGLVLMLLMIVVVQHLDLFEDSQNHKGALSIVVAAVTILSVALMRPASRLHRNTLAHRPQIDDKLQWCAIFVLVLLSLATIVTGILTIPTSS